MHILLAEDDEQLSKLIIHKLQKNMNTVDYAPDGETALGYALMGGYDLIILDWMMPGLSGVQVCQQIREQKDQTPILILTAKDELDDKIRGFDSGADDYLVKPFEFEELVARIRALGKRKPLPLKEEVLSADNLYLDTKTHKVTRDGTEIILTQREYQLLSLLMMNKGQVLTREVILDRIWGYDAEVTRNTVDAYIRLLRKKVDKGYSKKLIKSIRGFGYTIQK
ncbi:response regulator transcription factor [Microaerobacter geothermalis]|uniref:response regulator transcription factor n=1 Tax=Microaerobacter geothermalis TaxID=674972 RepID=UPI001F2690C5|nr:response regulator transcription factor [Microaerobacter geothermalis]MCF6092496.1 response regulator transcription factor [Microaerobacter geothermalis]